MVVKNGLLYPAIKEVADSNASNYFEETLFLIDLNY